MEYRIRSTSLSLGQLSIKNIFKTTVILLFVIINFNYADSLQCYKCTMTKPSSNTNEPVRLCAHFDYSEHYVVDCPYSTMCTKKEMSVNLPTPINGTERDCALQRYEYQALVNRTWQPQVAIEEPYAEGCAVANDKGLRSSRTEYCYCRGDRCNHATSPHQRQPFVFTAICLLSLLLLVTKCK